MQVLPPGRTGGPSRLFIMRPVATTLLMVAILLAGIIGYRFLPVSALPEVDKLIALSRLFGVSVGWLLGVEEPPEAPLSPPRWSASSARCPALSRCRRKAPAAPR